jgi:hypothetical protein
MTTEERIQQAVDTYLSSPKGGSHAKALLKQLAAIAEAVTGRTLDLPAGWKWV